MRKIALIRIALIFFLFFLSNNAAGQAALPPPVIEFPTASDPPLWAGALDLKWSSAGANYYQYHIDVLAEGTSIEEVVSANSARTYSLGPGKYRWAVRSCQDPAAKTCGAWSSSHSFEIVPAPRELVGGFVPCGRSYDDTRTHEINESRPCQFTDIFLLIKRALDFVLWRGGLIVFGLLAIATGAFYFFSMGMPSAIIRIKEMWRAAGIGYGIIFVAWLLVNLLLTLLGYNMELLGPWWEIKF